MNEAAARDLAVQTAKSMTGQRNAVVDIYNSFLPRPRGYKVKYENLLCATFVSAVYIQLGWTDIVPPECGAPELYKNMEALGCAVPNKNRVPAHGDLIFFGQSLKRIDHVGIVDEVKNEKTIYFYDLTSVVGRHSRQIAGSTVVGYAVPDYASRIVPDPQPQPEIRAGDLVTIKAGSRWYTGATIPLAILKDQWFVLQAKGDRVVLGMNASETRNIQSPIHISNVTLVTPNTPDTVELSVTVAAATYAALTRLADASGKSIGEIIDGAF